MTRPFRLRRSELSTPATSAKMMAKAAASHADLVFLDLEDAVAPSEKERARDGAARALRELDFGTTTRAVRINGVHTRWCFDDIVEIVARAGANLDVLIIPKVKHPRDVWFVDTLLAQLEAKHDLEPGRIGLEVLVEEAEALAQVEAIAACCDRLEALILGVGDLAASLGMRVANIGGGPNRYAGDVWHFARFRVFAAARAHGLDPIDGPFADFRNVDGYRRQADWAATLGAVGKWAIHPSQIDLAHEAFSFSAAEIDEARQIVDAVRAAERDGLGAANLGGVMIDAASTRIYQEILTRAELQTNLTGASS